MSAIAAFALECATSGRWVRGLLAVQDSVLSEDAAIRKACVSLAAAAAPHNWEAALHLLHVNDAVMYTREVCRALDMVARNPQISSHAYCAHVSRLLTGTREDASMTAGVQNDLFMGATRWVSLQTAVTLFALLHSPDANSRARVKALADLRDSTRAEFSFFTQLDHEDKADYDPSAASSSPSSQQRSQQQLSSPRDRRERARLQELRTQASRAEAQRVQRRRVVAAFRPFPCVEEVECLLRLAAQPLGASSSPLPPSALQEDDTNDIAPPPLPPPLHIPWGAASSILGRQPLTPELLPAYLRGMAVCAPHQWRRALKRVEPLMRSTAEGGTITALSLPVLWLLSRGSSEAAAAYLKPLVDFLTAPSSGNDASALTPITSTGSSTSTDTAAAPDARDALRVAEDIVSRTSMSRSQFYALFPSTQRPWYQLQSQTRRGVACALASGVRLDEIQLSALAKIWSTKGHWEECLALYSRLPLKEFQLRAVQSLIREKPALASTRATIGEEHEQDDRSNIDDEGQDIGFTATKVAWLITHSRRPLAPTTHNTCELIHASRNSEEALRVFRMCIQAGTGCNPQILSALMDVRVSRRELQELLHHYPAAVNEGIMRRAREEFNI